MLPSFLEFPWKLQAGGLLFSNNSNWIVSAGAQSNNFAGRVSAGAQSNNFGRRFCCCPIQLFFAGLKHLLYIFKDMIFTFQSVQDSIVESTPCFHPRSPGSIPWLGVESISKNWIFLFISKDKWFVKAAHSSESWDLCLKFFKNLELNLDSSSEPERFLVSSSELESRLKSKSSNIVLTQQKLWFQHRAQTPRPNKGNRVSSIEKNTILAW